MALFPFEYHRYMTNSIQLNYQLLAVLGALCAWCVHRLVIRYLNYRVRTFLSLPGPFSLLHCITSH
jgi:hypothetical protein